MFLYVCKCLDGWMKKQKGVCVNVCVYMDECRYVSVCICV